jgi:hypothetical protein
MQKLTFSKKHKLFTSKKLLFYIKKGLIKTYVWSAAIYRCEAWVINFAEKNN